MSLNFKGQKSVQKDVTKPDGEACNNDGTLKDASEITWLHSPGSSPVSSSKRGHNDSSDEDEVTSKKKTRVSIKFGAEKKNS